MFFITNPNQEDDVRGGEGQGVGSPDSSSQGPPDTVSPTAGLGEDDDDPLLDDGEVDMRAMMVVGGVMEFELLRLPPQSARQWGLGPSSKVGGARGEGHGWVVCMYTHTMCASCIEERWCVL